MKHFIETVTSDEAFLTLKVKGHWTVHNLGQIEKVLAAHLRAYRGNVRFDFEDIDSLDTSGAWRLLDMCEDIEASGFTYEWVNVRTNQRAILDLCQRHKKPIPEIEKRSFATRIRALGHKAHSAISDIGADIYDLLSYVGHFLVYGVQPSQWRDFKIKSFLDHLDQVGFRALPVLSVICFLLGAVFAQQGIFHTRPYGGEVYINLMVSFLVLRELGLIVTAIIVSARSVSAYAASIGAMKLQEEIDAMKIMGLSPMKTLVFPRILAMIIAMPLLTIVADFVMIGSALVAIEFYTGIAYEVSLGQIIDAVPAGSAWFGVIKAPFIGLVIAIIGCYEGARVFRSSRSLSDHTTRAVVKAIFAIILVDSLFALIITVI